MPKNYIAKNDGSITRVDTVSDLLKLSGVFDNAIIYINSLRTLYQFESTSGAVVDNLKVINTTYGGATRWVGVAGPNNYYGGSNLYPTRVLTVGGGYIKPVSTTRETVLYISNDEEYGNFDIDNESEEGTVIMIYPTMSPIYLRAINGANIRLKDGSNVLNRLTISTETITTLIYANSIWQVMSGPLSDTFEGLFDCAINKEFEDWYLPSRDELVEVSTALLPLGLLGSYNDTYMSSSEDGSSNFWGVNIPSGSIYSYSKSTQFEPILPIRSFSSPAFGYLIGDRGPAGGFVFYKNGYDYLEVRYAGTSGSHKHWCPPALSSSLIGTALTIGSGQANTNMMLAYAGYIWGAAQDADLMTSQVPPRTYDTIQFNGDKWINVPADKFKGIPSLTTVARLALVNPAESYQVWDTDLKTIFVYNGTAWIDLGSSGGGSYTGTSERVVGGITDGQIFTGASLQEVIDALIKQEKFPILTGPSSTFTSSVIGFREVGEIIASITFNATFNRGSINPQYTALSPFRSGLPNTYDYTGTGLADQVKIDLSDSQTINNYTVLINAQNWTGGVAYDIGVQPKSSYDNDYDVPLVQGNTSVITRTITGVYPFFGTTVNITTMTKQALAAHNSVYVQTDVVAESGGNKQSVEFPVAWNAITGIMFYNTSNSTWEWINGSKANSLLMFTVTGSTNTIQGTVINYNKYTNNDATTGARQLRWYTN